MLYYTMKKLFWNNTFYISIHKEINIQIENDSMMDHSFLSWDWIQNVHIRHKPTP